MRVDTFERLEKSEFRRLVSFIYGLVGAGVSLALIYTNDWENNTKPSVYVSNKNNRFKYRRYSRTSNFDLLNAIKFINK
jgi:hypothetical protein